MDNNILNIEIVTPQKTVFSGGAMSVTVPGAKAPFQILNMHAPIVSTLEIGVTKIVTDDNKTVVFATGSGFTEVHKNIISILVESAEESDKIDIEMTKAELEEVKAQLLEDKNNDSLKVKVQELQNKIKVAEKA